MSYDNFAETNREPALPGLATANSDDFPATQIPHEKAIFSHLDSLAHVHALQCIKCAGSEAERAIELESALTSLKNSFQLNDEQISYLHGYFDTQRSEKQAYVAERFSELEEKVTVLAKSRLKEENAALAEGKNAQEAISRLKDVLHLPESSIEEKIERKALKLAENAFLIAVKGLASQRLRESSSDLPLTFEDLTEIARRFEQLELSPRLLERANQLYENTVAVN